MTIPDSPRIEELVGHGQVFPVWAQRVVEDLTQTRWIYRRVGHDERAMTFASNGEIDIGAGGVERFWQLTWSGGRFMLEFRSSHRIECRLICGPDSIWRGRWEHFEQMPVELHPGLSGAPVLRQPVRTDMAQRSYSQHGEQQFLDDFFGDQSDGRFLDIGAADGELFSNTRALFFKGWTGALVEPIPEVYWRLEDRYRDKPGIRLLNAAVSDRDGYGMIWACTFESRHNQESRDTMDAEFAAMAKTSHDPAKYISREIRLVTPKTMLRIFQWSHYDFLSVDTEGLDGLVIRGILGARMRPRLILWEADKFPLRNQALEQDLTAAQYSEVYNNGINRGWALASDDPKSTIR